MGEANLVTVTFEIDEDILSEAEKVLAAQGLTMEAVLEGFCRRRAKLSQNGRHKMSVAAGCRCPKTDGVKWQGKRAIQPSIALLRR